MKGIFLAALSMSFLFSNGQQNNSYQKDNTSSQNGPVSFGVKAGVNIANLTDNQANNTNSIVDFNGGVFINIRFGHSVALEPEILYSSQGAKYLNLGTEKVNYINIPVLFQYLFPSSGFRLETGPQVGILTSAKLNRNSGGVTDIKSQFTSSDISWAFGLAYLSSVGLGIDARYNLGLTNIVNADSHNVKNTVWQFGLFYNYPCE